VTVRVRLVVPDGEIWSGYARMVIAKTLDGDIGVLGGHPPVLGILAEGGVIRILDPEVGDEARDGGAQDGEARGGGARDGGAQDAGTQGGGARGGSEVMVAVSSGFLSITEDRVSILSREAEIGSQVDRAAAQSRLDAALEEAGSLASGEPEPTEVKYSRALLRAAGERS
jgi:F-type H+-transporting ATPase subunit epsilon